MSSVRPFASTRCSVRWPKPEDVTLGFGADGVAEAFFAAGAFAGAAVAIRSGAAAEEYPPSDAPPAPLRLLRGGAGASPVLASALSSAGTNQPTVAWSGIR